MIHRYHKSMDGVLASDGSWVMIDEVQDALRDLISEIEEAIVVGNAGVGDLINWEYKLDRLFDGGSSQ